MDQTSRTMLALNKVFRYVEENLDGDLSLAVLAEVGCYSPFHLHRLFKAVTGETIQEYCNRQRLERVAFQLIHHEDVSISELAVSFGFGSNSSLTRSFVQYFGVSPTEFKKSVPGKYSKICKVDSKNGKEDWWLDEYICNIQTSVGYISMNAKIEIQQKPSVQLAFTTQVGVSGLDEAFGKMFQWSRQQQLLQDPAFCFYRIYHDSFRTTEEERVRMSIAVTIGENKKVEFKEGIEGMQLPAQRCLTFSMLIEPKDFGVSWQHAFVWMNENGYKKAAGNPYEILYNDYTTHPEKKCQVDLCIPIE